MNIYSTYEKGPWKLFHPTSSAIFPSTLFLTNSSACWAIQFAVVYDNPLHCWMVLFLVFLHLEMKSTFLWLKHIDWVFFLLYCKSSNIGRFLFISLCGMLNTLINVLYFFSVSSQCTIQSKIVLGWYGYMVYCLFTWHCKLGES